MRSDWLTGPKVMIFAPVLLLLMVAVACGGTAAKPVIVEKEVIREVIKEVPVIKEVIKEVVKEVVVVATMQPAASIWSNTPTFGSGSFTNPRSST